MTPLASGRLTELTTDQRMEKEGSRGSCITDGALVVRSADGGGGGVWYDGGGGGWGRGLMRWFIYRRDSQMALLVETLLSRPSRFQRSTLEIRGQEKRIYAVRALIEEVRKARRPLNKVS